ncbi:uncharacterized protein [Diabrotica undecimpunctata]|uniref:uncharacterized protein n=1 Tax=Diabrotica undecimpunctata TaxID=50387 RepID=UPI003B6358D3
MKGRDNINLNLTRDQVVRIISLSEDGRSQRYVANLVGVNQSTVSRVVVRYRETGLYERRAVTGRPRTTMHVDNRFLVLQALRRRHVTSSQLQHDLAKCTRNVVVSLETVRHILRQSGIRARVAATAPRLTREHRIARLTFAREHVNWNIDDWGDGQPKKVQELPLHPEKTTVWCGLWAGGIVSPYFFKTEAGQNVTVNGNRYRAMITDYLVPEIVARGLGDIWFQQDGATCLTDRERLYCENDSVNKLFYALDQWIGRLDPVTSHL